MLSEISGASDSIVTPVSEKLRWVKSGSHKILNTFVHRHSVVPVKLCDFDLASAPWTRDDSLATEHSEDSIDLISTVGSAEYMTRVFPLIEFSMS